MWFINFKKKKKILLMLPLNSVFFVSKITDCSTRISSDQLTHAMSWWQLLVNILDAYRDANIEICYIKIVPPNLIQHAFLLPFAFRFWWQCHYLWCNYFVVLFFWLLPILSHWALGFLLWPLDACYFMVAIDS